MEVSRRLILFAALFFTPGCQMPERRGTLSTPQKVVAADVKGSNASGIQDAWQRASRSRQVTPAQTPRRPVRWSIPPRGCVLKYVLSGESYMKDAGDDHPEQGSQGKIFLTMTRDRRVPSNARLKVQQWKSGIIHKGLRMPLNRYPMEKLSVAMREKMTTAVTTDGFTWQEQGPPSLWRGTPPLGGFFPRLPEGVETGSSASFNGAGQSRGKGGAPVSRSRIRLKRWIKIDGALAAVMEVSSHSSGPVSTPEDLAGELKDAQKGAVPVFSVQGASLHVVLADGRLLYAASHSRGSLTTGPRKTGFRAFHELRLVKSCGGPSLTQLAIDATAEERAVQAYMQLVDAALAIKPGAVKSHLAASLSPRRARMADLLVKQVRRFGPLALGYRILAHPPERITRDGSKVAFLLNGQNYGGASIAPITVEVEFVVQGSSARLSSLKVSKPGGVNNCPEAMQKIIDHLRKKAAKLRQQGEQSPPDLEDKLAQMTEECASSLLISRRKVLSELAGWRPRKESGTVLVVGHAIVAPLDRFVLLRDGKRGCAVRFTRLGSEEQPRSTYDWYYWGDTARARPQDQGRGTVGELRGRSAQGSLTLQEEAVTCGLLEVRWSLPNILYFKNVGAEEPSVDIALSPAVRLEEVVFRGGGVIWQSYRWGELAYDQEAARAVLTAVRKLRSR